jgi:hypothetical protein
VELFKGERVMVGKLTKGLQALPVAVMLAAGGSGIGAASWAQDDAGSGGGADISGQAPGAALDFLVGHWAGQGWIALPDGSRETFDVFERVEVTAGGHVVLVRGEGFAPAGAGRDGQPVHDAVGMISLTSDGYEMYAATQRGGPQAYDMRIEDNGFVWWMALGPNRLTFTTRVEDGVWTESGEYCLADGPCFPSMQMTLTRLDD